MFGYGRPIAVHPQPYSFSPSLTTQELVLGPGSLRARAAGKAPKHTAFVAAPTAADRPPLLLPLVGYSVVLVGIAF